MPTVETYVGYVEVDVELDDFDTDELKEELERRGEHVFDSLYAQGLLRDLYEKRRNGQDFAYELDEIIYQALGRVS